MIRRQAIEVIPHLPCMCPKGMNHTRRLDEGGLIEPFKTRLLKQLRQSGSPEDDCFVLTVRSRRQLRPPRGGVIKGLLGIGLV
jgi:hypothetical protein